MQQHRGEIVEDIVRKSGYAIKILAEKLGISRNTLYNKFGEHDLSYDFIAKIGEIIHYNFSADFPAMKLTNVPKEDQRAALWRLEKRYAKLVERYHHLHRMISIVSNTIDNDTYQKELEQLQTITHLNTNA